MARELKFNSLTRIMGVDWGLGEMHPGVKLIVDQLTIHHDILSYKYLRVDFSVFRSA